MKHASNICRNYILYLAHRLLIKYRQSHPRRKSNYLQCYSIATKQYLLNMYKDPEDMRGPLTIAIVLHK